MNAHSDEQIIEAAWQEMIAAEENECWAILEREYVERKQAQEGVVYGVIDLEEE